MPVVLDELPMLNYYNKLNESISHEEWIKLFGDKEYPRVRLSVLPNGTKISTVWLGLEHGAGPSGPLIFETLVTHTDSSEEEMYRYATEEEALIHHDALTDVEQPLGSPKEARDRWHAIAEEEDE